MDLTRGNAKLDFDALDHAGFMRAALAEAAAACAAGDLPIGAVVVCDGAVVGRGGNRIRSGGDKLHHAEIEALRDAVAVRRARHEDCVVYTTVEPCVMCLGTIVMADIRHVVFARADAPRGGSEMFQTVAYVRAQIERYVGGVLADESEALWRRYRSAKTPA